MDGLTVECICGACGGSQMRCGESDMDEGVRTEMIERMGSVVG